MTEPFIIDYAEHERNNKECDACWSGYPRPCSCGGLVHASFGDENYDCDYWLYYSCDRCGESYDENEDADIENWQP